MEQKEQRAKGTSAENSKDGGSSVISLRERERLFNMYVSPYLEEVRTLAAFYTDKYQDAEDNYILVLQKLFAYIHTYNPDKSIHTWLHIVTKRECFRANKKLATRQPINSDIEECSNEAIYQHGTSNVVDANFGTLLDNISDEVYSCLLKIEPRKLSAFLLYAQGASIREITAIEYEAGHLEQKNESLIKSRIYWAQIQLQLLLKEHGITKSSHTDKGRY